MEYNKQYKISQILSYISAGLSVFCIIFYFVGLFYADQGKGGELFNLIDMFQYSSLDKKGSQEYLALSVLLILALVFLAVNTVICFVKAKAAKIISTSLLFVAFTLNLAVLVSVCVAVETEDIIISAGFGAILLLIFNLVSFILVLLSTAFYFRSFHVGTAHEPAGKEPQNRSNPTSESINSGSIKFLSGSCAGYIIPVSEGKHIVIGKDPSCCSVVISKRYTAISRKHCDISFDPNLNMYIIKDFSSNGVFSESGIRLNPNALTKIRRGTVLSLARTDNILILL